MGVLRISLGCFIFFFIMFVTTCSTSKLHETRNIWHSRWWPLKFIMLVVSLIIPFFVHSDFIQLYGELARVGAGIFLILQLISVIEFITWWNSYWMPDERKNHSCFLGLFTSTVFYIASVCGIGVMYSHYVPRPSCTLNISSLGSFSLLLELLTVARAKLILADFVLHKMITSSEFDGIFAIEHDAGTERGKTHLFIRR